MKRYSLILKLVALTIFVLAITSVAEAQATRTWVSGVGDDVNPCSRTAPCKTFAGAISKTAKDGEISCLDPGGFGAVTITKSITIDCEDTQGHILASFTNGVVINITDAADIRKTVRLRGIAINGASTGLDGVRVLSALAVHLEEIVIDGFTSDGVEVNVGAQTSELYVWNSSIRNCVSNGILLQSLNVAGLVFAAVDASFIGNGSNDGIEVGSRSRLQMRNSTVTLNGGAGIRTAGTGDAEANIDLSALTLNGNGLRTDLGTGRVSNCLISGNGTGLFQNGGVLETYGNNMNRGNGSATSGTITATGGTT